MNPIFEKIEPSLIRAVNARKKPGDIDLGLGEPTRPLDARLFESAMAWVRENGCPYGPTAGYTELREAVARFYRYPGLETAENICITAGSQEAIYLAMRTAVDPATDEVLVIEPVYPVYDKICLLEGIRWRSVALDPARGFVPDADRVLEALGPDTRALVLCSPSNPTGRVWPAAELKKLADGLSARPGPPVQVISDEVYRHLYYTEEPPTSIAQLYPHTWVASSLSKSHGLTGLRLGFLMTPKEAMGAVTRMHHLAVTSPNTFSQRVALAAFERPESFDAHRAWYVQQREVLLAMLEEQELEHIEPEGAFYTMVRLEGPLRHDSVAAAFALIERAHVVTVPGRAFGPAGEGWLRVSWLCETARLWEGLRRLKRGMSEL